MTDYIIVFITAPHEEEAAKIARALVEGGLAGCVNIIRDIRSVYRWQGKVEDEKEVLMIAKTKKERFSDLKSCVIGLHSYTVPEIIAFSVAEGSEDYLKWLGVVTGSNKD